MGPRSERENLTHRRRGVTSFSGRPKIHAERQRPGKSFRWGLAWYPLRAAQSISGASSNGGDSYRRL